ncbi:MAG: nuclear transport factor 2 family protein [Dehalococcoidia bacterium]|nr:nuclear transport factor 2 family protein [Dehalococcoidia bacterium]
MAITREEVAQAMHGWVEAFNARDVARVWAMEGGGVGYGYRTRAPRAVTTSDDAEFKRWSARFFETFESRRMELEILETDVAGDLGLAWGTYVETFQQKGFAPEQARVRFSQVMSRDESGWRVVMFHRDIQPFDERGVYPRSLTTL